MLSLLCERQVNSCAVSVGIDAKIAALVKKRKVKKIQFATLLEHNPALCQHVVLGFTSDGEHLLSCSTDVGEDFGEEEEEPREMFSLTPLGHCCLHWWRLPLEGYSMTKARQMNVFDGCTYSSSRYLDIVEIPGTDWLVSHTWMFSSPSSLHSSRHTPTDVQCALSIALHPLRTNRTFEIVMSYSKSLTTPAVPLPLALALPGCVIVDLTYCISVVCYDHSLARSWNCFECTQPWLDNRIGKFCSSPDGVIAWETMAIHLRSSEANSFQGGGGGGGGTSESNFLSTACNGDTPTACPCNSTPHCTGQQPQCIGQQPQCVGQQPQCIGQQPWCIGQQVLDVEKWLVSELSECPEICSIGFYIIQDYSVHIEGACAVDDSITLSLHALVSSRHKGQMKRYSLQMSAVWDVRRGMVSVGDKVFAECSPSKVLECPQLVAMTTKAPPTSPSLLTGAHHLFARPGSGPLTSLLKLHHPHLPLEISLNNPSDSSFLI